jgi:hypothetical protein
VALFVLDRKKDVVRGAKSFEQQLGWQSAAVPEIESVQSSNLQDAQHLRLHTIFKVCVIASSCTVLQLRFQESGLVKNTNGPRVSVEQEVFDKIVRRQNGDVVSLLQFPRFQSFMWEVME